MYRKANAGYTLDYIFKVKEQRLEVNEHARNVQKHGRNQEEQPITKLYDLFMSVILINMYC